MAFAANGSAGQYMTPVLPTLISYHPASGICGTKINIKITAPYDLIAVTSHFFLAFGQQRCPAHAVRDTHDASGYGYIVSGDVPPFEDTRSHSPNLPLSLLIEVPDAQPLESIEVGTFTYHDTQVGSGEQPAPEDVTGAKLSQSPERLQSSPKHEADHIPDSGTNNYGYPPASQQAAAATAYDPNYTNSNNNGGNMIGTYHRTSYAADCSRHIPPPIKTSSQWGAYPPQLGSIRSPVMSHAPHASITRPSITSLPAPTSSTPQLIRTSTIQNSGSPNSSYHSYTMFSQKAILKISGDLDSMAGGWTKEEFDNRRRIVLFRKHQNGNTLTTSFKPVSVNERPTNSICISCIYWQEKDECYVTSVDTIHLLEQLVAAPSRFTVEEKNRIRRNLEGFRPLTVSKAKPESEEFFKIIMGFPNPKPRNIEKDVKVFPWKILSQALKKIISKYVSCAPFDTRLSFRHTYLCDTVWVLHIQFVYAWRNNTGIFCSTRLHLPISLSQSKLTITSPLHRRRQCLPALGPIFPTVVAQVQGSIHTNRTRRPWPTTPTATMIITPCHPLVHYLGHPQAGPHTPVAHYLQG
jgi:hypothetical protein